MAARRRVPTKAGERQIVSALDAIYDNIAHFISNRELRLWFGRIDEEAFEGIKARWQAHFLKRSGVPAPKLKVGRLPRLDGLVFARADATRHWLSFA